MEQAIINVDGMSCEHCVAAVKNAVGALAGITDVAVNLEAKTVTVNYDQSLTALSQINEAIEEQGYDVL